MQFNIKNTYKILIVDDDKIIGARVCPGSVIPPDPQDRSQGSA